MQVMIFSLGQFNLWIGVLDLSFDIFHTPENAWNHLAQKMDSVLNVLLW